MKSSEFFVPNVHFFNMASWIAAYKPEIKTYEHKTALDFGGWWADTLDIPHDLLEQTATGDMQPLTVEAMLGHKINIAATAACYSPRGLSHGREVIGYMALTGTEPTDYESSCGVLGSLIVRPESRGKGIGSLLVKRLLEECMLAAEISVLDCSGGFKAYCNELSKPLFVKHGFWDLGTVRDKHHMVYEYEGTGVSQLDILTRTRSKKPNL